jgi:hypothetical protein
MRYMLLIYTNEQADATASKAERDASMADYYAYGDAMTKSGAFKAGEALLPTSSATTVRVRDGKKATTHGPFAETKEQLGGFYMVDVANLDDAIEWAAKCPGAKYGSIEVRPVLEFPPQ